MDFYNVLFQSQNPEKFTEWRSIYSNFVFTLLNFFYIDECRNSFNSFYLRDCYGLNIIWLIIIYAITILFLSKVYLDSINLKKTIWKFLIFISILFSPLSLFLIERGNLLILAILFLSLAFLYRKNLFIFSIFMALSINIKIYLIILLAPLFLKKQYKQMFFIILFYLIYEIISLLIFYDKNFYLQFLNIFNYGLNQSLSIYRSLFTNIAITSPIFVLNEIFVNLFHINFKFSYLILLSLFITFIYALFLKYKNLSIEILNLFFVVFLCMMIKKIGGYSLLLIILYLPACFKYSNSFFYIFILLLLPYDLISIPFYEDIKYSWLDDSNVIYILSVNFGDILRPLIVLYLFIYLSFNIVLGSFDAQKKIIK